MSMDEVRALIKTHNPTMTRTVANSVYELLDEIAKEDCLGEDLGAEVLSSIYRQELGRNIADKALSLIDGKASLSEIQNLINNVNEDFSPIEDVEPVTDDPVELVKLFENRSAWKFNLETLHEKIPGISQGEFMIIGALVETGKTASWVSFSAGPGGWCEQGAKVAAVVNEEPAIRTQMRAVSANTGMAREEILADPTKAKGLYKIRGKLRILDDVAMSIEKLELYCKKHKPDILIIDQLDKVKINGNYEQSYEKLNQIYVAGREIAKKFGVAVVAISQTSAEAEGKIYIPFTALSGAKIGKASEADIVLGISKFNPTEQEEEDMTRVLSISKNKVSGNHGKVICVLNNKLSRYEA